MVLPTLPDADLLSIACLKEAMPSQRMGTQIPTDLLASLPFVMVRRFGGATIDPRFLDRAAIDCQTWAATRKDALDLAFSCRTAFRDAWLNATVFAGLGHIAFFSETTAPSELRTPEQADGVWRTQATYSLALRPI